MAILRCSQWPLIQSPHIPRESQSHQHTWAFPAIHVKIDLEVCPWISPSCFLTSSAYHRVPQECLVPSQFQHERPACPGLRTNPTRRLIHHGNACSLWLHIVHRWGRRGTGAWFQLTSSGLRPLGLAPLSLCGVIPSVFPLIYTASFPPLLPFLTIMGPQILMSLPLRWSLPSDYNWGERFLLVVISLDQNTSPLAGSEPAPHLFVESMVLEGPRQGLPTTFPIASAIWACLGHMDSS